MRNGRASPPVSTTTVLAIFLLRWPVPNLPKGDGIEKAEWLRRPEALLAGAPRGDRENGAASDTGHHLFGGSIHNQWIVTTNATPTMAIIANTVARVAG